MANALRYAVGRGQRGAACLDPSTAGHVPSQHVLIALCWVPPPAPPQAITPLDPRIHFALNCGANSCPAIKVYSPQNLELGLASAAAAFCASEHAHLQFGCWLPGRRVGRLPLLLASPRPTELCCRLTFSCMPLTTNNVCPCALSLLQTRSRCTLSGASLCCP